MKIKLFEDFKNDERKYWRLTDEVKSKIDSEIKNVLIELTDNGFEIVIDHFAKKISGDNSILVTINKLNDTQIFNTNDVKDNILVLIDYMNENYGVKGYDYGIEIPGTRSAILPGGKSKIDKEYPDNLKVIEIDIDITI